MNRELVNKLARALLYEGYILYPYRPSVKNTQRWTFGGVYPPKWSNAQDGTDAYVMQTQCLLEGDRRTTLRIMVRFLHLTDRTIGEGEGEFRNVQSVEVAGRQYQAWQEAVEREIDCGEISISELLDRPLRNAFSFPFQRTVEQLRDAGGTVAAILIRRREAMEGDIDISAVRLEENLLRVSVRISNRTPMPDTATHSRDDALMRSLISTHTILESPNGAFVSQTDPPDKWRSHAAQSANIGAWPVLVGAPGDRGMMLSSPIIIEDYPKIAPESPGDLFDSGEIDEILTLRIMTLTDDEKRQAAAVDDRVRDLLDRTQSLARDQLMGLHGTLRPVGCGMKAGDRVRLRPLGRGDVMDIALDGKAATIISIEQDFENRVYVSVTVDDDPGRDLGERGQPGHRFYFGIEEVEPLGTAAHAPEKAEAAI